MNDNSTEGRATMHDKLFVQTLTSDVGHWAYVWRRVQTDVASLLVCVLLILLHASVQIDHILHITQTKIEPKFQEVNYEITKHDD